MKYIFFIAIAFSLISCGKIQNMSHESMSIDSYKKITVNSMNTYLAKGAELPSFPTEEEVLSHNTYIVEFFEAGEIDSVFITPIYRDEELASGIIGFVNDKGRLLNIVTISNLIEEENVTLVDVYYIDGTLIGSYSIEDDKVVGTEIFGDIEVEETAADQARSWWACTKECMSDAHVACFGDKHCMTMLLIANAGGAFTSGSPLGSASIGIACGAVCIKNRNLDLLP